MIFMKILHNVKMLFLRIYSIIAPISYAKYVGASIGCDCILESVHFGSEPWLIEIGNHVEITSNVYFITHDGSTWTFRNEKKYKDIIRYGKIIIGGV